MTTTKELIDQYNALSPPKQLTQWKESKDALILKIAALKEENSAKVKSLTPDQALSLYKAAGGKLPRPAAHPSTTPLTNDGTSKSAAQWARELGKDPKVVRAKLRKSATPIDDYQNIPRGSPLWILINDIQPRGGSSS